MLEALKKSRISLPAVGGCILGALTLLVYTNQFALLDLITRSAGIGQSDLQRAFKSLVAGVNHGPWLGWLGLAVFWIAVVGVSYYTFMAVARFAVGLHTDPVHSSAGVAEGMGKKVGLVAVFLMLSALVFYVIIPAVLGLSVQGFSGDWPMLAVATVLLAVTVTGWWQAVRTTAYMIEGDSAEV